MLDFFSALHNSSSGFLCYSSTCKCSNLYITEPQSRPLALYSCLEHKTNSHRIQFHLNPHKAIWTIGANLLLTGKPFTSFPSRRLCHSVCCFLLAPLTFFVSSSWVFCQHCCCCNCHFALLVVFLQCSYSPILQSSSAIKGNEHSQRGVFLYKNTLNCFESGRRV